MKVAGVSVIRMKVASRLDVEDQANEDHSPDRACCQVDQANEGRQRATS